MEVEQLATASKTKTKKPRRKRATKVIFNITSKIETDSLDIIRENIENLNGKPIKKDDIINYENIKIKVKSTTPSGEVIITKSTKLEFPLTPRKAPSDIVLGIDSSFGMKKNDYEPNRYKAGIEAVENFMKKKAKSTTKDNVGIITFGYDWELINDFETISDELDEKLFDVLKKKKLSGRASFGGAIRGALEMFELHESDNLRYLIILTDGIDKIGIDPISEAIEARNEGMIIYPILIGNTNDDTLKKIAEITNGYYFVADTKEKLNKVYSDFASKLGICLSFENEVESPIEESNFETNEDNPGEDNIVIHVDKPRPKKRKPTRVQSVSGVTVNRVKKIWKWLW